MSLGAHGETRKNYKHKKTMAKVRVGDKEEEVDWMNMSALIEKIIGISENQTGQGVEVQLNKEEVDVFATVSTSRMAIGEAIYTALLNGLKTAHGEEPEGFHWEFNHGTRTFKTYNFGIFDQKLG